MKHFERKLTKTRMQIAMFHNNNNSNKKFRSSERDSNEGILESNLAHFGNERNNSEAGEADGEDNDKIMMPSSFRIMAHRDQINL